jgi:hypothetical protein
LVRRTSVSCYLMVRGAITGPYDRVLRPCIPIYLYSGWQFRLTAFSQKWFAEYVFTEYWREPNAQAFISGYGNRLPFPSNLQSMFLSGLDFCVITGVHRGISRPVAFGSSEIVYCIDSRAEIILLMNSVWAVEKSYEIVTLTPAIMT